MYSKDILRCGCYDAVQHPDRMLTQMHYLQNSDACVITLQMWLEMYKPSMLCFTNHVFSHIGTPKTCVNHIYFKAVRADFAGPFSSQAVIY